MGVGTQFETLVPTPSPLSDGHYLLDTLGAIQSRTSRRTVDSLRSMNPRQRVVGVHASSRNYSSVVLVFLGGTIETEVDAHIF